MGRINGTHPQTHKIMVSEAWLTICGMTDLIGEWLPAYRASHLSHTAMGDCYHVALPNGRTWTVFGCRDVLARPVGRTYRVEYLTATGRLRSVTVTASNPDAAIEAAVTATGCNFSDVQTTEEV